MQGVRCPVCWGSVEGTGAGCVRCQTPHHEDCFAFLGTCAVFGCGGRLLGRIEVATTGTPIVLDGSLATAPRLPAGAPRPPKRFRRGIFPRIAHAWIALYKNWRVALTLAVGASLVNTVGALMLDVRPSQVDARDVLKQRTGAARAAPNSPSVEDLLARAKARRTGSRLSGVAGTGRVEAYFRQGDRAPDLAARAVMGRWRLIAGGVLVFLSGKVLPYLCWVVLVVVMAARARGKEHAAIEVAQLTVRRLGRVLGAGVRAALVIFGPPLLVVGLHAAGLPVGGRVFMPFVVAPVLMLWVAFWANDYSLVMPVAAMGVEDEPGDSLARSRDLVRLGRWHVFLGTTAATVTSFIVTISISMPFASLTNELPLSTGTALLDTAYMAALNVVMLVVPIYHALLYFEGRRVLDAGFMKFAPREVTGGGDPADASLS